MRRGKTLSGLSDFGINADFEYSADFNDMMSEFPEK